MYYAACYYNRNWFPRECQFSHSTSYYVLSRAVLDKTHGIREVSLHFPTTTCHQPWAKLLHKKSLTWRKEFRILLTHLEDWHLLLMAGWEEAMTVLSRQLSQNISALHNQCELSPGTPEVTAEAVESTNLLTLYPGWEIATSTTSM